MNDYSRAKAKRDIEKSFNASSLRGKAGAFIDNLAPTPLGLGPPLPSGLSVRWPRGKISNALYKIPGIRQITYFQNKAQARVFEAVSG
jgi:hypothetical protein